MRAPGLIGPGLSGDGRRVWTEARAVRDGDGFLIMLDTQPLRLPGGERLRVGSDALAGAVAAEWQAAGGDTPNGTIAPDALPMTRLAATLQERVSPQRAAVVASLLGYVDGELLCYRATHPAELRARQGAEWQPWLDWCARRHGVRLRVTDGVMPVSQPPEARAAAGAALTAQPDAVLAALGVLVPALGSLVLALALTDGALPPPDATRLALLDELDQLSRWGADREAEDRRRLLGREVEDAARFASLARREEAAP